MNYQQQTVTGKNGVELVVALYDGMVRFLRRAIQSIEAGDVSGRRIAVKRTLDILIHLQSRLRMDVGGSSAKALSEFYAAIFALCLNGSRLASTERLREALRCVLNVREAWSSIAQDPDVLRALAEQRTQGLMLPSSSAVVSAPQEYTASSWSA